MVIWKNFALKFNRIKYKQRRPCQLFIHTVVVFKWSQIQYFIKTKSRTDMLFLSFFFSDNLKLSLNNLQLF